MAYHITFYDDVGHIEQSQSGRYQTDCLAVYAIIRAAKDGHVVKYIDYNGHCSCIYDTFTGGLLQDSKVISLVTGSVIDDESLIRRVARLLRVTISTRIADYKFNRENGNGKKNRNIGSLFTENTDFTVNGYTNLQRRHLRK